MFRLSRPVLAALLAAAALTQSPASATTADEYVALGDSYSAGNGAFSTNLDWGCGRNTYAYPYVVAESRPNTHLTFVACQGAVTDDVRANQVGSLSADTDYVSITVGGNDIGFANLIFNCADSWSFNCGNAIDESERKIREELPAKLDATYADIRTAAPGATVVVLGYGRLLGKDLSCAAANGISAEEATALNDLTDLLDATIADRVAAAGAGFTYQSSLASFRNHDICAEVPYANGKSWSIADGYHPTRAGYAEAMAPAVRAVIG